MVAIFVPPLAAVYQPLSVNPVSFTVGRVPSCEPHAFVSVFAVVLVTLKFVIFNVPAE